MSSETAGYVFNHTMLRVKDPKASIKFYTEVLGFRLIHEMPMEAGKFTLYFLAHYDGPIPESEEEKRKICFGRPGVLELTHNWGTEDQADFAYHNGNKEPQGFGHICISVDDIQKACERFDKLNVNYVKRLTDGKMKNIAFIADPDNYWVEIVNKSLSG